MFPLKNASLRGALAYRYTPMKKPARERVLEGGDKKNYRL